MLFSMIMLTDIRHFHNHAHYFGGPQVLQMCKVCFFSLQVIFMTRCVYFPLFLWRATGFGDIYKTRGLTRKMGYTHCA